MIGLKKFSAYSSGNKRVVAVRSVSVIIQMMRKKNGA